MPTTMPSLLIKQIQKYHIRILAYLLNFALRYYSTTISVNAKKAKIDSEQWVKYADIALYQAKQNCRNQVKIFSGSK